MKTANKMIVLKKNIYLISIQIYNLKSKLKLFLFAILKF